jgi:purine-binding chemotaxis protein CheW
MNDTDKSDIRARIVEIEKLLFAVRREVAEERRRVVLPEGVFQAVRIIIGGDEYAVLSADVQEIVRYARLTVIPNAPRAIAGALNLRGELVVVVNVALRFGVREPTIDLKTPIVIVTAHGRQVGLLVERVRDVVTLDSARVEQTSATLADAKGIAGVAAVDGKLVQLLHIPELLAPSELSALERTFSRLDEPSDATELAPVKEDE